MIFDLKFLVALIFITLSFITIFVVKSRVNIIATLIINHLVLIVFLSLTITNYNSFKEVVLTLIAYLMGVLFLITNYSEKLKKEKIGGAKKPFSYLKIIAAFTIIFTVFLSSFYLAKTSLLNTSNLTESKPYWQAQNNSSSQDFDISAYKKNRLKKKLNENFLLKRSSDVILIIVALSSILLLLKTSPKLQSKHDL